MQVQRRTSHRASRARRCWARRGCAGAPAARARAAVRVRGLGRGPRGASPRRERERKRAWRSRDDANCALPFVPLPHFPRARVLEFVRMWNEGYCLNPQRATFGDLDARALGEGTVTDEHGAWRGAAAKGVAEEECAVALRPLRAFGSPRAPSADTVGSREKKKARGHESATRESEKKSPGRGGGCARADRRRKAWKTRSGKKERKRKQQGKKKRGLGNGERPQRARTEGGRKKKEKERRGTRWEGARRMGGNEASDEKRRENGKQQRQKETQLQTRANDVEKVRRRDVKRKKKSKARKKQGLRVSAKKCVNLGRISGAVA